MAIELPVIEIAGATGGAAAAAVEDQAIKAITGYTGSELRSNIPTAAGGLAALAVGVLATPLTGALVASYAPRQPFKGAVLAVGLSFGLGLIGALLVAGATASALETGESNAAA